MKTNTKRCNRCETTKTVDQFYRDRSRKDGLQVKCKACGKAYHEANREEIRAKKKAYREANREKILAQKKAYHEANREKILAKKKTYREANREKILASNLEYKLNRRANDPIFRQVENTRRNIIKILHGKGFHQPTLDLLGCTGPEWRDHLESQWTEGMSWDNYGSGKGKWQCDHIIPVSAFDQTDPDQQKECWNYANTQPLWAADNAAKGSKLPTESTTNQ